MLDRQIFPRFIRLLASAGGFAEWILVCWIFAPYGVHPTRLEHGFTGVLGGRPFDDVIPPYFPVDEFPQRTPEPYVVYCGRLVHSKGVRDACDMAKQAQVKLVLIGHGDQALITYGEYVGAVSHEERNRILAGAQACLMPTQYIAPFGNVSAELEAVHDIGEGRGMGEPQRMAGFM